MKQKIGTIAIIISLMISMSSFSNAESAGVIEAKANDAIIQFRKEVKGADQFLSRVKGYLVFPSVVKGGFFVGGEYGEGVLRIDGNTTAYYSIAAASLGLQMGLQKTSYIIAFADQGTMDAFTASNGWEAGVDGAITVVKWGKGKDIGSISFEKPIYAFVFGAKGLMYNLTLKGTKFTKIIPE